MTQQGVVPVVEAASSCHSLGSGVGQSDRAALASGPALGPRLAGKGRGGVRVPKPTRDPALYPARLGS